MIDYIKKGKESIGAVNTTDTRRAKKTALRLPERVYYRLTGKA